MEDGPSMKEIAVVLDIAYTTAKKTASGETGREV